MTLSSRVRPFPTVDNVTRQVQLRDRLDRRMPQVRNGSLHGRDRQPSMVSLAANEAEPAERGGLAKLGRCPQVLFAHDRGAATVCAEQWALPNTGPSQSRFFYCVVRTR